MAENDKPEAAAAAPQRGAEDAAAAAASQPPPQQQQQPQPPPQDEEAASATAAATKSGGGSANGVKIQEESAPPPRPRRGRSDQAVADSSLVPLMLPATHRRLWENNKIQRRIREQSRRAAEASAVTKFILKIVEREKSLGSVR